MLDAHSVATTYRGIVATVTDTQCELLVRCTLYVLYVRLDNNQRLLSLVFHNFGSKFNLQQNGHHYKALFMLIKMVQISASYLIPSLRYISEFLPCVTQYIMQIWI